MMIGTPAYMPTEQASGGDVDQRCDLYSLGVMLYRMSTGGMPFKGKDAISLLSSLAFDTPAEPSSINPDIPPELNDLILQLLSKNRDDRPATATEVAQSLASVPLSTSGELPTPGPIHAYTTKPPVKRSPGTVEIRRPETVRPPRRRGPMIAVAIAFLIVAMVAGGMVMFRPTPIGKLPDDNRAIEPIEKPLPKTLTNSIGMEFVLVPKGKFWMGSPPDEKERDVRELQHEVEISTGFWLGKYEVTQEEYETVMGSNPSEFKGPKLPVEQVSWEDAKEFCKKLSAKEGKEYTLPTEAEWEYACRAGMKGPFSTGENLTTDQANYNGESPYAGNPKGLKRGKTTEVGSFAANEYGLCDMHGNVLEWCEDWHGGYDSKGVAIDPKGPPGGSNRVIRGGSWVCHAGLCRSANRGWNVPSFRRDDLGFRVALRSVKTPDQVTKVEPLPVKPTPVPPVLKAGEEMTNSIGMKLVSIPAGKFLMGSPESEKERHPSEDQHEVEITKGFWLGKYEVTQEEYEKVMGGNPSQFKGPKLPVETVNWEDAKEFCKKLSAKEGKEYTLPTEAEWEYACRAGTKGPFSTGENLTTAQANYNGETPYAGNPKGLNRGKTTEVGGFASNGYGLHDMHGNVWEWCEDWHGAYDTKGVGLDPKGPPGGSHRVIRGGSWYDNAGLCRSAYRGSIGPADRSRGMGFRVALRSVK